MWLKGSSFLHKFHTWRTKNLTHRQFIMVLSAVIGFIAGLGAVVIKNLTHFIQYLLEGRFIIDFHTAFYFISPLLGLALVLFFVKYVFKRNIGHGIPSTLYAISKKKGLMRPFQTYASLIAAPITVGFGGSVGLEGPTVATGASLGSNISRIFGLDQTSRTLLISCAAAGAMSSIFQAPIAAIVFAIEVFSLELTLASLLPLLLASVSAVLTSYFFFGNDVLLPFIIEDEFLISEVPFFILLGILSALCSIYFTSAFFKINAIFKRMGSPFIRLLVGGSALGILVYFIPPLYGEGYDFMNQLVQRDYSSILENTPWRNFLDNIWIIVILLLGMVIFKVIAMSLTFNAGGVGGIFAPVLFMGSALGHCFALFLNNLGIFKGTFSVSNFTLLGMAGLMAGVLHAPLTAIFLIAEITHGYDLIVPLMITAAVSFLITSQFQAHSVYTLELAERGELITHDKDKTVLSFLDIRQVIETNFVPLDIDMNLGEIVHEGVLKSSRNIFPVIDKDRNFRGILLLDDIRPLMFDKNLYQEVKLTELMQSPPETIDLNEDTMRTIMKKFNDCGAWNLPVIKDKKYKGFVSKSKLLTAYREKLIEVTV